MKAAAETGGMEERIRQLERQLEEWKTAVLNVAVIGNSGVGKLSFINAIRGLTTDDEGAAVVDAVQTSVEIRDHPHPNNSKLVFWDLPGVGTDRYPRSTYLDEIDVDRYDFFLLMTADRFTENDTWLSKEIRKRNKKYFFVRTKIGVDISNSKKTHNEETVIETIRQDITHNLRKNGCDAVPVFLIDNYELNKFEFEKLKQQIIQDYPEQKRSALIFSLEASSEEMIRLKVAELRSRIWKSAALSAAGATVPIPGVSTVMDLGLVTHEALSYYRQLGLDSKSLQRNAKLHSADPDRMQSIISNALGVRAEGAVTVDGMRSIVTTIVTRSPTLLAATVVEEGVKVLPLIGSLVAPPISFAGTRSALNLILDKFEETALKVVKFVTDSAAGLDKIQDTVEVTTDSQEDAQRTGEVEEHASQEN